MPASRWHWNQGVTGLKQVFGTLGSLATTRAQIVGEIMFIYSAALQIKPGRGGEAASVVAALRDEVEAATGLAASAWTAVSGAPIGSFYLSASLEGTTELLAMLQNLNGSTTYQALAPKIGELLHGPAETNLVEVVAATAELAEPKPFVSVTRATIQNGNLGAGIAWSGQILEYITRTTGVGGMLGTAAAGSFFDVAWMIGNDDGAQIDELNAKLNSDPTYLSMVDQGGDFFVPGTGHRMLLARMQ